MCIFEAELKGNKMTSTIATIFFLSSSSLAQLHAEGRPSNKLEFSWYFSAVEGSSVCWPFTVSWICCYKFFSQSMYSSRRFADLAALDCYQLKIKLVWCRDFTKPFKICFGILYPLRITNHWTWLSLIWPWRNGPTWLRQNKCYVSGHMLIPDWASDF